MTPLLEVRDLTVTAGGATLVDRACLTLEAGRRTGIIGESGAGKTMTALAVMGLLPDGVKATGSVLLRGEEILGRPDKEIAVRRGASMSMVFQEPMTALNPVMRIGRQIAEPLRIHGNMSRAAAAAAAVELLRSVGVGRPERRARSFPHELSGGQRQRAVIAMALACGPNLVIADEPTTALDATVQAQVLSVLRDQAAARGAALVLITHDLPVVASIAEKVIVMADGAIVETGRAQDVFRAPAHEHTRRLVSAVPPMSRATTIPPRRAAPPPGDDNIVEMRAVTKLYRLRKKSFTEPAPIIRAVDGITLDVRRGETLGIVGESGSGKSTLARMMMGLERPTVGDIAVNGAPLHSKRGLRVDSKRRLRGARGVAQMVFQDPIGSLDPQMLVEDAVAEPLRSLRVAGDHGSRVRELLTSVSLPEGAGRRYPHELSGGQRQRVAIARALAPEPRLLIADEPVSALDMSVQAATLDLLDRLKRELALTMVFISHDLSVIHEISDRVVVLEHGRVVESGPAGSVFTDPRERHTRDLLAAIPRLDGGRLGSGPGPRQRGPV